MILFPDTVEVGKKPLRSPISVLDWVNLMSLQSLPYTYNKDQ